MASVMTVRDFSQIFDAYAQFEESIVGAKMEQVEASSKDPNAALEDDIELDVELRLARLERLMERRPFLVNSVLLRQNPNNVHEWLKRVKLFKGNHVKVSSALMCPQAVCW